MTEPIRILFIDDEINILRALERVFLDEDYEIFTACSATEALEILSSVAPVQVVVSDYRMPQMNGVELLRMIRDTWPETVRAVLSGYADTGAIVSAINDGQIYRFIPKPWDDVELRMTIATAVKEFERLQKEILYAESLQKKIDTLERENSFLVQRIAVSSDGISPEEILDNLPAGIVVVDGTMKIVQCNRVARSLLQAAADDENCADHEPQIPEHLSTFLNGPACSGGKVKRLVFGSIPTLVYAAFLERPSSDRLLLAVLTRENTDD